jgi:hypothetical protein
MWDSFLSIEFDSYGFTLDSYWFYVSLSWQMLLVSAVVFIGYRIYRNRRDSEIW